MFLAQDFSFRCFTLLKQGSLVHSWPMDNNTGEWETSINNERVQNQSIFSPSFCLLWGMIVKKSILCRAMPFSGSLFLLHIQTIRQIRHSVEEES